ncbi:hypothetical protein MD484_g7215, partial [Candolleomyces efflorescens]
MALKRSTHQVDGTIPIPALLYTDSEQILSSQDGVGIYDGPQKSSPHQSGSITITTHRLFYIDNPNPETRSFYLDLGRVGRTEYYAGLFTSSPKVTLYLDARGTSTTDPTNGGDPSGSNIIGGLGPFQDGGVGFGGSWECSICAFRNPPGLSPSAARICGLCGVPRDASSEAAATAAAPSSSSLSTSDHHSRASLLSSSLPSSSFVHPNALEAPKAVDDSSQGAIPCPACTFLNHPSLRTCELCETELPRPSKSKGRTRATIMKSAPVSRPSSPDGGDDDDERTENMFMKLSFRKGGDKAMYATLKRSLKARAWEDTSSTLRSRSDNNSDRRDGFSSSGENVNRSVGISAILQTVEHSAQGRSTTMQDALQDLEALRVKAKDMVKLAAELNDKLTAAAAAAASSASSDNNNPTLDEPEEATFIRNSLTQLGLQGTSTTTLGGAPVTLDMMKDKDEQKWYEELARELGRVLQGSPKGLMSARRRGIVALDEVWGGWNRVRGIALLPPSTLLSVLPLLPSYTSPPIHTRTFSKSGLKVLHTPAYSRTSFSARLASFLVEHGGGAGKTSLEVAMEMRLEGDGNATSTVDEAERYGNDNGRHQGGISLPLAQEMIEEAEDQDQGQEREGGWRLGGGLICLWGMFGMGMWAGMSEVGLY